MPEHGTGPSENTTAGQLLDDQSTTEDRQNGAGGGYQASPPKRRRRTKAQMEDFRSKLYTIVEENQPCTVRQVYYVGIGRLYEKSESHYDSVCRELGILREREDLPWEWIADHTRLRRIANMHEHWTDALKQTAAFYRRDMWAQQPRRVEVWCESDSISGVLNEVTYPLGVALLAARGQSSKAFVHDSALEFQRLGKPVTVLYVGDWDPTGLAIDRSVQERMERYTKDAVQIDFRRIAVTPDQIRTWGLTSHGTNAKDNNHNKFVAACREADLPVAAVEAEALPPRELRRLLENEIYDLVEDDDVWNTTIAAEVSERDILTRIAQGIFS
jgi:hypothetical protein